MTDAEWALIEPCLPVAATGPLPRRVRDQFNGILWRFRTGSGWRDVPERYGPWSTLYSRFNGWAKAGVFQGLIEALITEAALRGQGGLEVVSVDSTIVRAHQESAGLAVAAVAADKAYSSKANRSYLRRRKITAVIPEKTDQQANRKKRGSAGGRPVGFDPQRYRQRNTVERCFQKIKTWRGLATRHDKTPESDEAGLYLRGSIM